jgi:two-component system sensor histidine kinase KdpD
MGRCGRDYFNRLDAGKNLSPLNHHVKIAAEKELPVVRVDANAVSEVVYTLIDNAAKYSSAGSSIIIYARRGPDGMVTMAVEDEGNGN